MSYKDMSARMVGNLLGEFTSIPVSEMDVNSPGIYILMKDFQINTPQS